jgi:DNA topoisomerase I
LAVATRNRGWRRTGSRNRFHYLDARGNPITDPAKLERIESLRVPPAWRHVWIASNPRDKLQATGIDAAGRKQYLYHPEFRAAREEAKFEKLILFGERLPSLHRAMADDMSLEPLEREWVSAVAVRLINLGWFRVGSERYTKRHRTFGITTLRKSHASVRGNTIAFRYQGKHRSWVHTAIVDPELADAVRTLLRAPGGSRLFRYRNGENGGGGVAPLSAKRLNEYVQGHLGDEFTAKDFRTWGGTLIAAIAFAERGAVESATERRRIVAAVMRRVGEKLGNTPAVARSSYVSPAVVEQYEEGVTIEDFRPRHLRVVGARDIELDPEERCLLSLLRSWRMKRARDAA